MLSHGILTAPLELAACNRETKAEAMPAAYDANMQEGEADCYEFQASLGYIVSFRPAWSIQLDTISKELLSSIYRVGM